MKNDIQQLKAASSIDGIKISEYEIQISSLHQRIDALERKVRELEVR